MYKKSMFYNMALLASLSLSLLNLECIFIG